MPVVKKPDGWYWESKGPYATKQKAVQVGQAAYASGYRESAMDEKTSEFICYLLQCVKNVHLLHLQTRSYAMHMALGSFYEELDDLTDAFAESYQGKYTRLTQYIKVDAPYSDSPMECLMSISEYVQTTRALVHQDSELQNEIDSIQTLINSTIYKLRFLS